MALLWTLLLSLSLIRLLWRRPWAVIVRDSRPTLSFVCLLAWIVQRLLRPDTPSLLSLQLNLLEQLQRQSSEFFVDRSGVSAVVDSLWKWIEDVCGVLLFAGLVRFGYRLVHERDWSESLVEGLFQWAVEHIPQVSKQVDQHLEEAAASANALLHKDDVRERCLELPRKGRSHAQLLEELQSHSIQEDAKWKAGKVSGTVYGCDDQHTKLMGDVFATYSWSNPLHPGYWPRLNQCEAEVIAMTAHMLHADSPIGAVTSGGTESIILAIRAHLNHYGRRRHIHHPELVCGASAHAAVDKACEMFGIRKVVVGCDSNYRLDLKQVRRNITSNTILIYASAPTYPQGVVDPIAALSDIALEYDIGLHVDACLGGFVLPFVEDAPVFDFRHLGVTSMSADTHKFGYASKGTSVVVYRTKELRHGQYFSYAKWSGGLYATPTIAGSRPGGLVACAWASLMAIGYDGYQERARQIVEAARLMAKGVDEIDGVQLLTEQPFMVVCVGSDSLDIYQVQDAMSALGWSLNALQNPASFQICVTLNVAPKAHEFVKDLRQAVRKVQSEPTPKHKQGTAGIYGTASTLPAGPVDLTLKAFTDATITP